MDDQLVALGFDEADLVDRYETGPFTQADWNSAERVAGLLVAFDTRIQLVITVAGISGEEHPVDDQVRRRPVCQQPANAIRGSYTQRVPDQHGSNGHRENQLQSQ